MESNKLKLNNDYEVKIEYNNYDINNTDTKCPSITCGKNRYYLKFYCDKTILYCQDCGYWEEI